MRDVRRSPGTGSAVEGDGEDVAAPGRGTQAEAHEASAAHESDVEGGADNVNPESFNAHPGNGYGKDYSRLARAHGKRFTTIKATPMYQLDGTAETQAGKPPASAPAGTPATQTEVMIPAGTPVEINAGAITKLVLRGPGQPAKAPTPHGHAVECVFIFNADGHGGWMPTSALPPEVKREQLSEAKTIEHERGDAHHQFGHGIEILKGVTPQTEGVEELYTYPHQTTVANKAKYYFGNLSLNLPFTSANRVGVLTTNIPGPSAPEGHALDPYREFFPREPAQVESIPLFRRGSSKPTGRKLTFVYGYVKTDAGGKVYGWINRAMLPNGFDKRKK
jgi:hypothetical protein